MAVEHAGTKTIIVIRHAKAEDSAATDHDRGLTSRGRADAVAAGEVVGEVLDPDAETVVLVSSAVRARQTWEAAAAELTVAVEQRDLDELYEASGGEAVDLLALLPDEVDAAIVVGHNPTMQAVVQQLENGDDDELSAQLDSRGLPTAGVAVLEHEGDWADLEVGSCRLVRLEVPRG